VVLLASGEKLRRQQKTLVLLSLALKALVLLSVALHGRDRYKAPQGLPLPPVAEARRKNQPTN